MQNIVEYFICSPYYEKTSDLNLRDNAKRYKTMALQNLLASWQTVFHHQIISFDLYLHSFIGDNTRRLAVTFWKLLRHVGENQNWELIYSSYWGCLTYFNDISKIKVILNLNKEWEYLLTMHIDDFMRKKSIPSDGCKKNSTIKPWSDPKTVNFFGYFFSRTHLAAYHQSTSRSFFTVKISNILYTQV